MNKILKTWGGVMGGGCAEYNNSTCFLDMASNIFSSQITYIYLTQCYQSVLRNVNFVCSSLLSILLQKYVYELPF